MNNREKFLATIVGVLVFGAAVVVITDKVREAFNQRARTKRQVQDELDRKQLIIDHASRSVRDLVELEEMSLPSDPELARSQYQAWLSEIVDRAGIEDQEVKYISASQFGKNRNTQFTFSVNGRGDLREIVTLLHEFYSVNAIHRIRRLPLRPIPDSREMKFDMRIEALVMSTAERDKTFDISPTSDLALLPIEELMDPIVQRNMFSPANRSPAFDAPQRSKVERGSSWSMSLDASDPDELDTLTFEFGEDAPEGMELDRRTGQLRWLPDETGLFPVTFVVRDNGIPIRDAKHTMEIEVVNPETDSDAAEDEQPKLKFDDARFTYAIGMVEDEGQRQLWLQIRTRGEIIKLVEGDPIQVGSIDAKIARIGERVAEFDADGETFRIELGEPLVESE